MNMFFNLIASLGMCYAIMYSTFLKPYRQFLYWLSYTFVDFFRCAMCVGFWTGFIVGFIQYNKTSDIILFSFASSVICFFADIIKKTYLKH